MAPSDHPVAAVVDPTILVAWHAGYIQRSDRARLRLAGFMTLEVRDGKVAKLREWYHRRSTQGG